MSSKMFYVPAIALTMSIFLSRCSVDAMRPDINKSGGLRVFTYNESEMIGDINNPNVTDAPKPSATAPIGDPSGFSKTKYTTLDCVGYSKYLKDHIVKPISEVITKLPADKSKFIYFRVLHTGYNLNNVDELCQGTPYTYVGNTVVSNIGGSEISNAIIDIFGSINGNKEYLTMQKQRVLDSITASNVKNEYDWFKAQSLNSLDSSILSMWGNSRLHNDTLGDYISAMSQSYVGTIPNLSLKCLTGAKTSTSLLLNQCADSVRYVDKVSIGNVDKMFLTYNQSTKRDFDLLDKVYADDRAWVRVVMDGYSKTLILFATDENHNIKDLLTTEGIGEVQSIIGNLKPNTMWEDIQNLYPDDELKLIQANTLGVN